MNGIIFNVFMLVLLNGFTILKLPSENEYLSLGKSLFQLLAEVSSGLSLKKKVCVLRAHSG